MIILSSTVINFGSVSKGETVSKTITIFNTDASSVDITAITSISVDYLMAPTIFSIDGDSSKTFTIEYTADLPAGSNSTISVVNSAGPNEDITASATVIEPIVNLDTSLLSFGQIGNEDELILTRSITNDATNGSVLVVSITSSDTNFVVQTSNLRINSGESEDISIKFTPTTVGLKSGTIDIVANDSTVNYSFSVDGESILPTYTITATSLAFGSVAVNDDKILDFTISNTSTVNLILSSIVIDDIEISVSPLSSTITPSNNQKFTVTFTPTNSVVTAGNITITSNSGPDIVVSYTATGVIAPLLDVNKTEIDYGIYSLNENYIEQIILTNNGVIDLTVSAINFPTISNTTFVASETFPFIISPGSSTTVDITVNSTDEVIFADTFTIVSDSFNGDEVIDIIGTAQSPLISTNFDELDFGTLAISESRGLQLKISNSKDVNLDITLSFDEGTSFSTDNLVFTVLPNNSSIITVNFLLDVEGVVTDVLNISSNDISNPLVTIPLLGTTNAAYNLRFIPTKIERPEISRDIVDQSTLNVYNRSSISVTIQSFSFTISSSITSTYTITAATIPVTLAAGETVDLTIDILSSDAGEIKGYLKFETSVGKISLQYEGEVFSPDAIITPTTINFGTVTLGSVGEEVISITNDSLSADLKTVLTSDNELFKFKQSTVENLAISNNSAQATNSSFLPSSVSIIDRVEGVTLVQGDPANVNEFSINSNNGKITFNQSMNGKSVEVTYDYSIDSITIITGQKRDNNVTLVFQPREVNVQNGQVTIATNDISNPSFVIPFTGEGLAAVTSLIQSNDLVEFFTKIDVPISQRAVLKNDGNVKLYVTAIDFVAPFFIEQTEFDLDPQETFELRITFTPTDKVLQNQNIVVHSNAPDLTIPVIGQGKDPEMVFAPSVSFGTVAINTSNEQIYTIENTGDVDLNVVIEIISTVFSILPPKVNIIAGRSVDLKIKFTPTEETVYNETFRLISDDPDNADVTVTIDGTGENKPVIEVATLIEFAETDVRDTIQEILTIGNVGSSDLTVSSVIITNNGQEYRVATAGGAIVSPGGSTNYTILFTPLQSGLRTGEITIDNDNQTSTIVSLRGRAILPEGTWLSIQLQDVIPDSVMSIANGVNSIIPAVKTILSLVKSVLDLAKILLIDVSSALTAIYLAIKLLVNDFMQDLQSADIFMLPIIPSKKIIDPNVEANTDFGKFLASVGGGSQMFSQRIKDSFDDVFDSKRPIFSDSAVAGAVIIAVDSGNIADIVAGVIDLKRIFGEISFDIDIQPPINVFAISETSSSNAEVLLRWSVPESVKFSIGALFTEAKMLDIINSFEIYRLEKQSQMVVSTVATSKNTTDQRVIRRDTGAEVTPIATVDAGNFFKQLTGSLAKNAETSNQIENLGYKFIDSTVEFGTNYFYAIRTVLNEKAKSKLSNEVLASPRTAEAPTLSADINRCINYICEAIKEQPEPIEESLPKPVTKLIDVTGVERFGENIEDGKAPQANAGELQVSTFTLQTIDAVIDSNTLEITNATLASRNSDVSENDFLEPDEPKSSEAEQNEKILRQTKLIGDDVIVSINNGLTSSIEIRDRQNLGYKRRDKIRIKYNISGYTISCGKSHKDRFDQVLCNNGQIQNPEAKRLDKKDNEGPCEDYNHGKVCSFHGGNVCKNIGFTLRSGKKVENRTLFQFDQCQNGTMGGEVIDVLKQYRNSDRHTIETTGICAGYIADAEATPSQFPDWVSIQPLQFVSIVDKFIKKMDTWVKAGLDSTQKGSATVAEFIDLLALKIEKLEEFIDEIQEILDFITLVFSANAGLFILNIPGKLGGVERIKNVIAAAENGPDSDENGFTAGIVFLYGGPNTAGIERLFKLFF